MKPEHEREGKGSRASRARVETNKHERMFLRVTRARVPKESPNQNKDCLNYEPRPGKDDPIKHANGL